MHGFLDNTVGASTPAGVPERRWRAGGAELVAARLAAFLLRLSPGRTRQQLPHGGRRERLAMWRTFAGGVQGIGDLPRTLAGRLCCPHAFEQCGQIGALLPGGQSARHFVFGDHAAEPVQMHFHKRTRHRCPDRHAFEEQAHHVALVVERGPRRIPQGRQVDCQRLDLTRSAAVKRTGRVCSKRW